MHGVVEGIAVDPCCSSERPHRGWPIVAHAAQYFHDLLGCDVLSGDAQVSRSLPLIAGLGFALSL